MIAVTGFSSETEALGGGAAQGVFLVVFQMKTNTIWK